jgi:hypothetical protein
MPNCLPSGVQGSFDAWASEPRRAEVQTRRNKIPGNIMHASNRVIIAVTRMA